MSGIVSRLSVLGKVWLGLAAGAMALIIFCLAASGSSLFFPLVSLWCNAALFALALDRKSTRLNSSHPNPSRMPSSA